jgi:uncharacterized membrane protein
VILHEIGHVIDFVKEYERDYFSYIMSYNIEKEKLFTMIKRHWRKHRKIKLSDEGIWVQRLYETEVKHKAKAHEYAMKNLTMTLKYLREKYASVA